MTPITDELLDQMVETIVDTVAPEKVILFGSRARGDHNDRSDVDLIVIESEPFGPGRSRLERMALLHKALSAFWVPKDLLVYSRQDADYWRDSLNHVLARALREGRVLHERP